MFCSSCHRLFLLCECSRAPRYRVRPYAAELSPTGTPSRRNPPHYDTVHRDFPLPEPPSYAQDQDEHPTLPQPFRALFNLRMPPPPSPQMNLARFDVAERPQSDIYEDRQYRCLAVRRHSMPGVLWMWYEPERRYIGYFQDEGNGDLSYTPLPPGRSVRRT